MPLYNTTKGSANSTLTKRNFAGFSDTGAGLSLFEKHVARVSGSPSTSLQRKMRSGEFQRIKYAYSKHEACIDSLLIGAELMSAPSCSGNQSLRALKSYLTSSNDVFFNQMQIPDQAVLITLSKLEENIFPLVVNIANNSDGGALRYEIKAAGIFNQIRFGASGRKQFVFYDGDHAIYIDLYKDEYNNISVITVDSLSDGGMDWGGDFVEDLFKEFRNFGRLAALILHTDVQKSAQGCKFFSLHFAKKAIKDPVLIAQHILNIENAKYLKTDTCHNLSNKETEHVLNVDYYKHAQSSTRLKLMLPEKKSELLSDGKTLLQHHADFRVKKISAEKTLRYSNSIDFFEENSLK
jgi:hypothetical protein